jgi:hypothetical protein
MMRLLLLALGVACLAASGCDSGSPADLTTAARLQSIANIYLDYAAARGVGPANERQLRKHAQNVASFKLATTDQDRTATNDELFRSDRDGEPFEIRYGIAVSQKEGTDAPPIAFERLGTNGTRFVAFANGQVVCISEDAATNLVATSF